MLYRDASLWSAQHNLCDLCSAAEADFISEVEQSDSGFTYGLNLKAGVTMMVGGWDIEFAGGLDYVDERSQVKNRENPSQPETSLGEQNALDWRLGLGFRYHF